ncbi:MAG: DUF3570 domain-containing protein [Telluria sp.]
MLLKTTAGKGIMAAALALPGLQGAHAEPQPEEGLLSFKYLHYQDSQSGDDRIRVKAPALSVLAPVGSDWSLAAGAMVDSISGASPAYHTEALTAMRDLRRAYDVAVTRYSDDATLTLAGVYSGEPDYRSRTLSVAGTISSASKNTTWNATAAVSNDRITPVVGSVRSAHKRTLNLAVGVTQVLSQRDLAQLLLTVVRGEGYFSDPYKTFDRRPGERHSQIALLRWNHFHPGSASTTRLSYRYYRDSFGIRAHTATAEYVQPLASDWNLTPSMRVYTQNAADFYVPVDPLAAPFATNPPRGARFYSEDQRLSAYGGGALGIKLSRQFGPWQADLKLERYAQRGSWRIGGGGSEHLAPFHAAMWQLGLARRF